MISGMIIITIVKTLTQDVEDITTVSSTLVTLSKIGLALYLSSFPLAGFLMVQGALHTADKKKFILRLLVASLIAELLIDYADFGFNLSRYWWNGFNYFCTMLISLAAILFIETKVKKFGQGTLKYNLFSILAFLLSAVVAVLLQTSQGATGVMTIIAVYMFMSNIPVMLIAIAALQLLFMGSYGIIAYAPAVVMLLLLLYNGKQGLHNNVSRWIIYLAYPISYVLVNIGIRFM